MSSNQQESAVAVTRRGRLFLEINDLDGFAHVDDSIDCKVGMVVLGVQLLLEAIRDQCDPILRGKAALILDLVKDELGDFEQVHKN